MVLHPCRTCWCPASLVNHKGHFSGPNSHHKFCSFCSFFSFFFFFVRKCNFIFFFFLVLRTLQWIILPNGLFSYTCINAVFQKIFFRRSCFSLNQILNKNVSSANKWIDINWAHCRKSFNSWLIFMCVGRFLSHFTKQNFCWLWGNYLF